MAKIMMFIDGTWLYSSTPKLAESHGMTDLHIDYGLLPKVLGSKVAEQLRLADTNLVRVYLFGSVAVNYDLRDEEAVQRRLDFFNILKEEFHYEVDVFPINFRGRRLRKKDRDANDDFEPKEKCVDIALATSLLYYAAIPYAYDLAIVVIGDRDYLPVLQHVRRLGKRIAIASIRDCCAPEYTDPLDHARVKDMDIIWLNDVVDQIELTYEKRLLDCQSPLHVGDKSAWTTYRLRRGQPFYCEDCRRRFAEEKAAAQGELVSNSLASISDERPEMQGNVCSGEIEKVFKDKGYGFIRADKGGQYFFHLTDLENSHWNDVSLAQKVQFQVKREPAEDKAGAAERVRLLAS